MKLEHCELENLKLNKANPRVIKDYKFHKLVKSILVLPKMLELRPIVVDNKMVVLGGNMRLKALQHISKMDDAEIYSVLSSSTDFKKKSDEEQQKLTTYWNAWVIHPKIPFIKATELTNAEMQEFIIKDNIGFGEWDWDMLANEWETTDLSEWGVDMPTFSSVNDDNLDDFFNEDNIEKSNDSSNDSEKKYIIEINCKDSNEQQYFYDKFISEGLSCRKVQAM